MLKKLGIIFLFFFSSPLIISCSFITSEKIFVSEVYDGDTISGNNKSFRLLGVNTPEMSENINGTWIETEGLKRYWAVEAKKYAISKLRNKKIVIDKIDIDDYGRIISKWNYGYDFGISIVRMGLARVEYISSKPGSRYYTDDYKYYEKLLIEQKYASDNNNGFWENGSILKGIF